MVSCGQECPLECESTTYRLTTSQAEYPSRAYANALVENSRVREKYAKNASQLNYELLKRSMVQISVFYKDLGYEQYEEFAKTELIDLVSNIGGTLGLFLGMSFLSFVEIFDIILQICFSKNNSIKLLQ